MVSVVIASFDRFERLMACIRSVVSSGPQPEGGLQLIVVTSTYSVSEVAAIELAGAKVLRLPARTLASAAHNTGAAAAVGKHLLFLDDDNVVAADAIWRLSRALAAWSDAVLLGPVMYYGSAPDQIWCAGVARSSVLMRTTLKTWLPNPIPDRIPSEDFPNCFIVRREDFDLVGGFDDVRFPHHMAESDFARRLARKTGRNVYCVPRAKVWHFIGHSLLRRLHMQDSQRAYLVSRDRTVYAALYGNRVQWFVFLSIGQWALATGYLGAILLQRANNWTAIMTAYLKGMYSGLRLGIGARRSERHAGRH